MIRFLFVTLLLVAQPAFANHPGERLDEVMTEKEPAFEAADRPTMPDLDVAVQNGDPLRLGDLHDQIVVISFAPIEAPWDDANWRLAVPSAGATAVAAADRFAALSSRDGTFPMVHVIDHNGRHAAIFHGAEFQKTNLTLYVNALTNNAHAPKRQVKKSWWERLTGWF